MSAPDDSFDVDDVITTPELLTGLDPAQASIRIRRSEVWREESLNRGSHAGLGWFLGEYEDELPTGRVIRWHPVRRSPWARATGVSAALAKADHRSSVEASGTM